MLFVSLINYFRIFQGRRFHPLRSAQRGGARHTGAQRDYPEERNGADCGEVCQQPEQLHQQDHVPGHPELPAGATAAVAAQTLPKWGLTAACQSPSQVQVGQLYCFLCREAIVVIALLLSLLNM